MNNLAKITLSFLLLLSTICIAQPESVALESFIEGIAEEYFNENLSSALEKFLMAELFNPKEAAIKIQIAEILFLAGEYERALKKINEALLLSPKDFDALLLKAKILTELGECEQAAKIIKSLPTAIPEDYLGIAQCLLDKKLYKLAENVLTAGLERFPESENLKLKLANIYLHEKKVEQAKNILVAHIKSKPKSKELRYILSQIYIYSNFHDSAFIVFKDYLVNFPFYQDSIKSFAQELLFSPLSINYKDSVIVYIAKYMQEYMVRLTFDYRYWLLYHGFSQHATEMLRAISQKTADSSKANLLMGIYYEDIWCDDSALIKYMQVMNTKPLFEACINSAFIYLNYGFIDSAVYILKEGTKIFHGSKSFWYWGGMVLLSAKEYELASHFLAEACRLSPTKTKFVYSGPAGVSVDLNFDSRFGLADSRERAGARPEAISILTELIREYNNNPKLLNYLGYIMADDSFKLDSAIDMIKKALSYESKNPAYIDSYGWALYRLGKYEESLSWLKKAYILMPNDPVILEHVGDVFSSTGMADSAMYYWKKALDRDPGNKTVLMKIIKAMER